MKVNSKIKYAVLQLQGFLNNRTRSAIGLQFSYCWYTRKNIFVFLCFWVLFLCTLENVLFLNATPSTI